MKENEVLARMAEFDGLVLITPKNAAYHPYYRRYKDDLVVADYHPKPGTGSFEGRLKYDSSWDWIMPVVAKIRLLLQDNDLYERAKEQWELIEIAMSTVEIKVVNVAVLHFIEWYNANKQ